MQSNIQVNIDTTAAAASLKNLQRQISAFHSSMAKSGAAAGAVSSNLQQNLINSINRGGQFAASMKTVRSSAESFTVALEKNKLSMGQYFKYAGASTKTFGRLFTSEFNTIEKVARERVKSLQTQYIKLGRDAGGAIKSIAVRPLTLDMESLATKTAMAAQKQQLFNQLMRQGSTNLLNFGKNTQWAGRQLMVGFTIPLAYLGTTAAKTFMEMEKQAVRFKRVYGELFTTSAETDAMAKEIEALGRQFTKYGVAVADTMKLAADAASMGKMGADLTAQVAEATRLAVLGGVEQAQALETTISLTNAFGVAAEDLAGKINFLNAVENQTATSIEDLTIAVPKAGPVIQQLGGDVEDLAFFLTAMKEGGINASEGANALKSGLAAMINPTGKAAEFLQSFGINLKGIVETNKGDVRGTVVEFAKALDTLDPLNRAQAIEQLFGKFQFARLSTLFQNVVAEGSQASKVLTLTKATTEELAILSERELKRVEDSPMFKFQKSIEDLKISLVPLGEAFLKAVTPIVEFGAKVLEKFNSLDEGAKGFIVGLTAVLGAIGPIAIMTFGLLANGVANIIKGFLFVKNVFSGAGKSSQDLGSQLQYMTSEQLEAAAVAASLDQVHNKLIQTFSSEASAIGNLAAAYQKAISAQMAFNTAGTARGPRKKMATGGIVSGPGTGTSDSVPAMLSNGEAVIPAESVKEYPGLVAGLIAGNIPGFASGGTISRSHAASPFMQGSAQWNSGVKLAGLESLAAQFPQFIKVVSNLVTELPQRINVSLVRGLNQSSFSEAWNARSGKMLGAAQSGGLDVTNQTNVAAVETLEKQVHDTAIAMAKSTKDQKVNDDILAKATREVIDANKSAKTAVGQAARAFDLASKQVGQVRVQLPTATVREGLASGQFSKDLTGKVSYGKDQIARESQSRKGKFYPASSFNPAKSYTRQALMSVDAGVIAGIKEATQQASPSKAAKRAGRNIGVGAIQGIETGVAGAKVAGAKIATATQTGANEAALLAAGKNARPLGRKEQGPLLPGQKRRLLPNLSSFGANGGGDVARSIGSRAQQTGMVASTAMGMASMLPGPAGQKAQEMAGPIMALSALTMFIQGPWTAALVGAVAVIGTTVFSIMKLNSAYKESQEEAIRLKNAIGGSTEAIRTLSEFAGTVTAGESADRRRADKFRLIQTAPGKTTFGESFIAGDQGKGLLENLKTEIANNKGDTSSAYKQLAQQLKMSVISGALTQDQAGSIASEIGAALGDATFGVKVRAEIVELVGPDGQDLTNNPLAVATKLATESMGTMDASKAAMQNQLGEMGVFGTEAGRNASVIATTGAGVVGGALAGVQLAAGVNAAIAATGIGAPIAAIGVAASAAIGAVAGGIIAATTATAAMEEQVKKAGALAGAYVADSTIALQQQAELMDVLDQQYSKKLLEAEAEGDITEYKRLQLEYDTEKNRLSAKAAEVSQSIVDTYNATTTDDATRESIMLGVKNATDVKYKDDPNYALYKPVIDNSLKTARDSNLITGGQEIILRQQMLTGDLDAPALNALLTTATTNGTMEETMSIVIKFGGDTAGEMQSVLNMIKDKGVQTTLTMAVNQAPTEAEAQKIIDFALDVQALGGVMPLSVDTMLSFYANPQNNNAKQALDKVLNGLASQEVNTVDMAYEVNPVLKMTNIAEGMALNEEYFNALKTNAEKETYIQTISTILNIPAPQVVASADFKAWLSDEGAKFGSYPGKHSVAWWARTYAESQGRKVTTTGVITSGSAPAEPAPTTTGGGGTPSSVLDSLTKKLKELRNIQIKVTEGWAASGRELMKWLGSGKDITIFSGLKQQLRALGAGEDFIELIAGMDAKEYEKRKNELFEFDKKGNIVKLKSLALATGKALKEIALGEFQSQQQQTVVDIGNQTVALKRLTAAGISVSDAYNMIEDAAFAAAIASKELSDAELKKIVKATKEAIKQMKIYKAAQAVQTSNEDIATKSKVIAKLAASNYTDEQRQAILDSADLQTLYLQSSLSKVNFDAFQLALANAVKGTQLEIDTNKLTTEGLEQNFANAMNMAMEKIEAQEMQVNLKFDAEQKNDKDVIDKAQQRIADYQFEVDNLDASLKPIEEAEKKINEEYDARVKALEEVSSINEDISRQQKQQLSVAEAITSGDISAAARAAQEARAAEAAAAIERQKKALEQNKDLTLAGLVNAQGLTRTQVEEKIKDLKDKIFEIEENILEPAQRAVELSERRRDAELATLETQRLSLVALQNRIDLAKTEQQIYDDAAGNASTIGGNLVNAYETGNVGNTAGPSNTPKVCDPGQPANKPGYKYTLSADGCSWVATKITVAPTSSNNGKGTGTKTTTTTTAAKSKLAITPDLAKKAFDASGMSTSQYMRATDAKGVLGVKGAAAVISGAQFKASGQSLRSLMRSSGGMIPKYFDKGGIAAAFANTFANNTDTIPAMLTPGEFVIKKSSVDSIGYKNLQRINNTGMLGSNSVYNYDVNINVKSEANVNDISRAVITEIKRIDSQRIRGNKL